jgi:hypothetical protein
VTVEFGGIITYIPRLVPPHFSVRELSRIE